MRTLLPVLGLLLACGCTWTSTSDQVEARPRYAVLSEPPDAIIDRMAADYPRDIDNFRRQWTEEASASPLDGQRAVELFEVACYADVMCLGIEYPLPGSPAQRGYYAMNWTVPLLIEELWHATGKRFSDDTVRRQLHRLGYVWKRPRYVLAPDPQREKKEANSLGTPETCGRIANGR